MKKEKGAATLIEYAIILPIVLGVVLLLIFVGYTMHQKAVMESAAQRTAIYVARTISDPSYVNITTSDGKKDVNDIVSIEILEESILNNPYRYLFLKKEAITNSELDVADLIKKNQIFLDTSPTVSIQLIPGIFSKVVVTATQEYGVPKILERFEVPPIVKIETECVVYVNQPAEFIRNADYVIEIVTPIIDKAGEIVEKLKGTVSKISFFNKKMK